LTDATKRDDARRPSPALADTRPALLPVVPGDQRIAVGHHPEPGRKRLKRMDDPTKEDA